MFPFSTSRRYRSASRRVDSAICRAASSIVIPSASSLRIESLIFRSPTAFPDFLPATQRDQIASTTSPGTDRLRAIVPFLEEGEEEVEVEEEEEVEEEV